MSADARRIEAARSRVCQGERYVSLSGPGRRFLVFGWPTMEERVAIWHDWRAAVPSDEDDASAGEDGRIENHYGANLAGCESYDEVDRWRAELGLPTMVLPPTPSDD